MRYNLWVSTSGWMALIGVWSLSPAPLEGRLGAGFSADTTPPFSTTPRDRGVIEAGGSWRLPPARLSLHVEGWRQDTDASGDRVGGPGDITAGAEVDVWRGVGLVWLTKLPNAEDEEGLGTDETDVALLARVHRQGPLGLYAAGWVGLTVLGDPVRYRSQDGALTTWGVLGWQESARLRIGGLWASRHNPARLEVALSGRLPLSARLGLGAEALAGLRAPESASPTWGMHGWVELHAAGRGEGAPDQDSRQ